jgi:long-chain fatty acid transport protein
MFLLLLTSAWASSIDNLEVAGPWGTPTSTDPTALWWNPAGLAGGAGTRVHIEAEKALATVKFDREDPYNGGLDIYQTNGTIPFAGVVSDFGVRGLGVGAGLAIPIARGGTEVDPPGTGSYQMRHGATTQAYLMLGAAYQPIPQLAFGATLMKVGASWAATTDFQNVTDLDENISDLGQESGYTDDMIEDEDYRVTVTYEELTGDAWTASFGLRSEPVEALELGAAFTFGTTITHSGGVTLDFGCPPQEDTLGRFGAEAYGICDTRIYANSTVTFSTAHRLQLGAAYTFDERVRAELMGGWVGWGVHDGFDIVMTDVAELNDLENPDTAELIEKDRFWARDNTDSFWVAVDSKLYIQERWTLGGRLLFDSGAVPDATLSPNNYDAPTVSATGLVAVQVIDQLQVSARYTRYFSQPRTITDSAYLVTLDEAAAPDEAYFYPQMNGTYASAVNRFGLTLRGRFGGGEETAPPEDGPWNTGG